MKEPSKKAIEDAEKFIDTTWDGSRYASPIPEALADLLDAFAEERMSLLRFECDALRRNVEDAKRDGHIAMSSYEARALKRLLEETGGAHRWKIRHRDGCNLVDGDWGYQIYGKILEFLKTVKE